MPSNLFLATLLTLALSVASLPARADDDPKLFPISEFGPDFPQPGSVKFGFIDATGKIVIPLTADYMSLTRPNSPCFTDGLQPVQIGLKTKWRPLSWGYIDAKGQLVIQPQFSLAFCFTEGLGLVRGDKGYGFIDHTGKYVIPSQFEQAEPFSCGLASVTLPNHKHGYIDHTGKVVITLDDPNVSGASFSEGLARVYRSVPPPPGATPDPRTTTCAFIDSEGNPITDFKFKEADDFHEGLAAVQDADGFGYIDKTGKLAFPAHFFLAWNFSEGVARVQLKKGGMAYIDHKGNLAFTVNVQWAEPFSEGLAEADGRDTTKKSPNGALHGFIDHTGKWVILPTFLGAQSFHNGVALVSGNGFTGYIDKTGHFVWQTKTPGLDKFFKD